MNNRPPDELCRARIKRVIEQRVFVKPGTARVAMHGRSTDTSWLFDFRAVLLDPGFLEDIVEIFWRQFGHASVQIGGMESAAIPLVTALVYSGHKNGLDVNGFFIRKSHKKDGLMKALEGRLRPDVPVVLVDDLVNDGASLIKQVGILEELGATVKNVWTILRFRGMEQYEFFSAKGLAFDSLFSLNDFKNSLGTKNLARTKPWKELYPFTIQWKFASHKPAFEHVMPKSDPILDAKRIYIGSDIGTLWAVNQSDGSVAWSYATGPHIGKGIFSSPALARGRVFFGGYDGSVYALDAQSGQPAWISREADWIGSSPAIAENLGLLFVGLEYGLWRRRGGIIALDLETGERKWLFAGMPCFTHSSPLYIKEYQQVVIGSNDGAAYLFDAKNGTLLWKLESGQPREGELNSGFSEHDIKESFAYDVKRNLVIFGNLRGFLFFVDRASGQTVHMFEAEYGFFSTPVIYNDTVLAASLDKHLYCIDLNSGKQKWRWNAGARIFATPTIINGAIYIGSNTGKMSVIDPATGHAQSFLQLTERITNKIIYNPRTKRFFIPTQANEVYCVEKL